MLALLHVGSQKDDVLQALLPCLERSLVDHCVAEVDAHDAPGRPHRACRPQRHQPRARGDVQHPLPRSQRRQLHRPSRQGRVIAVVQVVR